MSERCDRCGGFKLPKHADSNDPCTCPSESRYSHKDGLQPCPGAIAVDDPETWFGTSCRYCGSSYHCGSCGRGSSMMGHYAGLDEPRSCQA